MTIYTVISIDELHGECADQDVLGSWKTRGEAVRKCAEYITDRAGLRPDDIGQLLFTDENHADIPQKPHDSREVHDYLVNEIAVTGAYSMCSDWCGSVDFLVVGNELAD